MATAAALNFHDVTTTMNYYAPIGNEAPYQYALEAPKGVLSANIGTDPRSIVVHDARGREEKFSLDRAGFQFVKHVSQEKGFDTEARIKTVYYEEVEELINNVTGAKRVYIFDHTIRRKVAGVEDRPGARGPVERVHIDQTFDASVKRVRHHFADDEANRLLSDRVRIINVWRPIHHPAAHKPLAVSDWRYLDVANDLVHVRLIYPERESSTFGVRYNPDHRWYYLSNQKPEEATLIKCYYSKEDRARLTPHSAFLDASAPPELPQRESIEVRCLVFDAE
ncbi:hypothetical protein WOLCODRAFT_157290 [Wolfiporia cocos MD-104 SS10]|uniref:Methyltransferase n=1 Tax=Wolfiporia cocos (strain MD-104) TaxID=742152 RepID=A0A2H3J4J3_WOLCO|nr:hypothetical protein WOLCODRAFT_157290 [Wolfiporia cocos MD-104 SS10]